MICRPHLTIVLTLQYSIVSWLNGEFVVCLILIQDHLKIIKFFILKVTIFKYPNPYQLGHCSMVSHRDVALDLSGALDPTSTGKRFL